jgi:glycosyltransferase involved in cell wall biosynthesis
MQTFVDAIKEIASLDMLFYVPSYRDISPSSVSQLKSSLFEYWNTKTNLFLCHVKENKYDGKIAKSWHNLGAPVFSLLNRPSYTAITGQQQVKAFEDCLQLGPDAVFVHKLNSMCPLLLTRKTLPPIYFDLDDIEHIVFKRGINQSIKWSEKILRYAQLPSLLSGERRAIRLAYKTFVCSELDRDYLTNQCGHTGVVTIPNAVTIPERQELTSKPTILFMGSYYYKPNVDAAEFLIEKVWPRIYKVIPGAELIIAGVNPERIRGYGSGIPGVSFTGFVDDLDSLYRNTKITVTPILVGGGTRLKIIEAAAYGKPVVSTRLGVEGLDFNDSQELLLRDDAESFTEACLQLLSDHTLSEKLGSAARSKAIELYDRKNIVRLIQKQINRNVL